MLIKELTLCNISLGLIASNHTVKGLVRPLDQVLPGATRPVRAARLPVPYDARVVIQRVVTSHAHGEYWDTGGWAVAFHDDLIVLKYLIKILNTNCLYFLALERDEVKKKKSVIEFANRRTTCSRTWANSVPYTLNPRFPLCISALKVYNLHHSDTVKRSLTQNQRL